MTSPERRRRLNVSSDSYRSRQDDEEESEESVDDVEVDIEVEQDTEDDDFRREDSVDVSRKSPPGCSCLILKLYCWINSLLFGFSGNVESFSSHWSSSFASTSSASSTPHRVRTDSLTSPKNRSPALYPADELEKLKKAFSPSGIRVFHLLYMHFCSRY